MKPDMNWAGRLWKRPGPVILGDAKLPRGDDTMPWKAFLVCFLLMLTVSDYAQAQQTSVPGSNAPSSPSAPVSGSDKTEPNGDDRGAAQKPTILKPSESPQDQNAGGNRAQGDDRVRASEIRHEQNETDLANFTKLLAGATILLMIATIGLWWETRALAVQAREASKDTKRSIQIAEDAAGQTARAAQAAVDAVGTERAWMSLQGTNVAQTDGHCDGTYYDRLYVFSMNVVNTGRSPAIKMSIHRSGQVIGMDDPLPIFEAVREAEFETVVGPGIGGSCNVFAVFGEDIERLRAHQSCLAFYVSVEYEIVSAPGNKKILEICGKFVYFGDKTENGRVVPAFNFIPSGQQNNVS